MSEFQTSVQLSQPNGVPGEVAYGIPANANALTVTSATAGNYFGNAYTRVTGSDNTCAIGGTGGGEFAGILIHSHGVATGTVEGGASFVLPNQTQGTFLNAGAVKVRVAGNCSIGDAVQYHNTTGNISTFTWGGNVSANCTAIRNAKVEYASNAGGAGVVATIKIVGV